MPDPIDTINDNLAPKETVKTTEKHLQLGDGTSRVIARETVRIISTESGITTNTSSDIMLDDLGNPIQTPEDIGGFCRCGRLAHKSQFYSCWRCGLPLCRRCATLIGEKAYCSWCAFIVRLRRLFGR